MSDQNEPSTPRQPPSESSTTYTRRRLLVAGALAGLPVAVWLRTSDTTTIGADNVPAPTSPSPNSRPVPPSTSVPVIGPNGADTPGAITRELGFGMVNDDVASLQQRLHDLHFDPGPVDGWFGEATLRSVWAFEKLVLGVPRAQATGVVTPSVWDQMRLPMTITPRRVVRTGHHRHRRTGQPARRTGRQGHLRTLEDPGRSLRVLPARRGDP